MTGSDESIMTIDMEPKANRKRLPPVDFTASGIKLIVPEPGTKAVVEFRCARQPGLCLRVTPAGAKSWTVRYTLKNGSRQRVTLGSWPALPISLARTEAAKVIGAAAKGEDPASEKKTARVTEKRVRLETVSAVGDVYLERASEGRHRMNGRPMKASTLALEGDYLKVVKDRMGKERLADLTRLSIQATIDDIAAEMSPGAARHARNVLSRIFSFALWQDVVTNDPVRFVSAPTWVERERVLTDAELRAIWQALDQVDAMADVSISPAMRIATRLAAVTLQRRGDVTGMRLSEVDFGSQIWTIPADRYKGGRTHVVPLSDVAVRLVEEARDLRADKARESDALFASPRNAEEPVKAMALTHAWGRLMPKVRVAAPTAASPDRTKAIIDARPHDLRRTGATNLTGERLGFSRFIVSKVLGHTGDHGDASKVTRVYDRNAYLPEKRRALAAWADLLQEIVADEPRTANVVRLRASTG